MSSIAHSDLQALGPAELQQRAHVDIGTVDECWPWTHQPSIGDNGRARIYVAGKTVSAYRYAYEIYHGAIPSGMDICHACDNPICCNPYHLRLGSHAENMNEMAAKGRHRQGKRRERIDEQVLADIRNRANTGESYGSIARIHDIHVSTVSRIVNGERRKAS